MALVVAEEDPMALSVGEPADLAPVSQDPMSRWVLAILGAGFLAVAFVQSWGLILDDTKLPLIVAPLKYVESALHLWNQHVFGGTVIQTGLFFPMGLFFGLGHLFHLPIWCTERLWLGLLLTIACWGIVRLCEALNIGSRWARVLAGLAYCAAPIVVTWAQTTSDLVAVSFLPWMLLPLVTGSRQGSPRRAAAKSGVAVALMGGGNAAVVVATLPVAVIWLVTRQPSQRRRRLIIWWLIAVGLACFWWASSVFLAGKYGFNYLPYTETTATTTGTGSAFEAIRGASYWLDYFSLPVPLLPGAWTIVSSSVVIVGTTILAALGLVGLCRRIPERLFLVTCLAFGVTVIAAGYAGSLGDPFSGVVRYLLRSSLGPFRNVSKFSPDVTLPLALGLAWSFSSAPWGSAKRKLHTSSTWISKRTRDTSLPLLAIRLLVIAALAVSAAPFWQGHLYRTGGFARIPSYWSQAGQWLDHHQGNENALLVPGSSFGSYTWGFAGDEPLQTLTDTSVFWRNLIPLGSNGYIQMLDVVEKVIDGGTSTPGLSQYLSRAGIRYVVERNDLNLSASAAPPPALVHQVLSETKGLTEVASFGPTLPATQVGYGSLPVYNSPEDLQLRPIEIFRVNPPTPIVQSYPVADPLIVSGDLSSLLSLSGAGVLAGHAAVLSGDALARGVSRASNAIWAITDGNQRRDTGFGIIRNNTSYLLSQGQKLIGAQPGTPMGFNVVFGSQHQTVSSPLGAASVSASSYSSSVLQNYPAQGPAAAFDADPSSSWVANATDLSLGQWVAITLRHPISMSTIAITPLVGDRLQPTVSRVKISTAQGSVIRDLPVTTRPVRLTIPRGPSAYLRVTIEAVRPATARVEPGTFLLGAGFTDIAIPGVKFEPQMKVPADESASFSSPKSNAPVVSFSRSVINPNLILGQGDTDDPDMARVFELPKPMVAGASGYVVPSPGPGLEQLLAQLTPQSASVVQATASSWLGQLPRYRPDNLVDLAETPWIAAIGDNHPSVELKWNRPGTVDSIYLSLSSRASRPTKISITGATGGPIVLSVPKAGGRISFTPMVTNSLRIDFISVAPKVTLSPTYGVQMTVPVGLAAIGVPGPVDGTAPNLNQQFTLPCGQGPPFEIDGTTVPTTVSGTVGDLEEFKPLPFIACTPPGGLQLASGGHTFSAKATDAPFEVTSIALQDTQTPPRVTSPARTVRVDKWNAESRTLTVGAGPATLVALSQNYNAGSVATMGGHTLKPVRIDGWRQGYVVPAGGQGTLTLVMAPDTIFRWFLFIGAALLLGLAALALVPSRRPSPDSSGPRSPPSFWVLLVGSFAVLAVVGGPLCLLALPLLWVARRWGTGVLAATAFVAFVAAGAAAAWHPATLHVNGAGAFGAPAQAGSVVALAAVLVGVAMGGKRSSNRDGASSTAPSEPVHPPPQNGG